jgi:hypothetical protein
MYKTPVSDDYRRSLETATREYEALLAERTRIDERLGQLAQTIGSLMRLCNLTPTVSLGLTDTCRMVLKAAGHPLTALEVRERLQAMGFDVARYANDLASIHTVLKRLQHGGEADLVQRSEDKPGYRWRKPPRVIALSSEEATLLLGPVPAPRPAKKRS